MSEKCRPISARVLSRPPPRPNRIRSTSCSRVVSCSSRLRVASANRLEAKVSNGCSAFGSSNLVAEAPPVDADGHLEAHGLTRGPEGRADLLYRKRSRLRELLHGRGARVFRFEPASRLGDLSLNLLHVHRHANRMPRSWTPRLMLCRIQYVA